MQNEDRKPRQPGFGVLLNVLNFPELRERRHIATDTQLEVDVENFCTYVVGILNKMPHDEQELISAEKDELCGFRLTAFSGYAYRAKFHAFWEFVRRLPTVPK